MSIDKGRDLYASTRTANRTEPTVESLAKTAAGRGRLIRLAQRGNTEAREALRGIGQEAPAEAATYDDHGGASGDA